MSFGDRNGGLLVIARHARDRKPQYQHPPSISLGCTLLRSREVLEVVLVFDPALSELLAGVSSIDIGTYVCSRYFVGRLGA
jgi:hypothetical protein